MRKFRLLQTDGRGSPVGNHYMDGPEGEVPKTPDNPKGTRVHGYRRGDIIETDIDLCKRFNQPETGCVKFEEITDVSAAAAAGFNTVHEMNPTIRRPNESGKEHAKRLRELADEAAKAADLESNGPQHTLDAMTLKELVAFAAEEEIPLKSAKTREEVLKVCKEWKPTVTSR